MGLRILIVVTILFISGLAFPATAVPLLPVPQRDAASNRAVVDPAAQTVTVTAFRFNGNTLISSEELQALLATSLSRPMTLAELRQAAELVTMEYQQRGNSLARAYLPLQTIRDGVVEIAVLEGRIGRILVEGNRNYSTEFIRNYILSGESESSLTVESVERALLLLNSRFTGLKVSADLKPGTEPGTSDLSVRVDDGFPLHGTLSLNNYGSEFVSRYRFGGQFEWSNALLPGDLLSAGGMVGDKVERMLLLNAGYTLPLNTRGTMGSIQLLDGTFEVGKDFADLGIHNNETTLELSVSHPLIKTRSASLTGQIGFKASDARYYLYDELTSKDNTRALYAALQGDLAHHGGKSIAGLTFTRGLGEWFNGTASGDLFASRAGADNNYWRLNASLARLQPFGTVFSALLRLNGQYSPGLLLAGEEWLIGGVNSVHGYAPGEESGQRGYSVSLALQASPLKQRELLQLSAFLDHGYAWRKSVGSAPADGRSLTGAGVGLYSRFNAPTPVELRFDVGWPLDPKVNSLDESPVLYLETSFRF